MILDNSTFSVFDAEYLIGLGFNGDEFYIENQIHEVGTIEPTPIRLI